MTDEKDNHVSISRVNGIEWDFVFLTYVRSRPNILFGRNSLEQEYNTKFTRVVKMKFQIHNFTKFRRTVHKRGQFLFQTLIYIYEFLQFQKSFCLLRK